MIKNPETNRNVSVKGKTGKKVIKTYCETMQTGGLDLGISKRKEGKKGFIGSLIGRWADTGEKDEYGEKEGSVSVKFFDSFCIKIKTNGTKFR